MDAGAEQLCALQHWRQGDHVLGGRIRHFYGLSGASFPSLFFFLFPSGDLLICNRKVHCFPVWYFFDYLKRNPRGLFSQNSDCIIDVIMMYFAVSLQLGWLFWEALSTVSAAMCCACMAQAFIPLHMCTRDFQMPFLPVRTAWDLPQCKEKDADPQMADTSEMTDSVGWAAKLFLI